MSRSNDPDYFFQTQDSIAERDRKAQKSANKNGQPIRVPSKILALIADPTSDEAVYVAEASGTARRVELDTGNIRNVFSGPTAPLTSLALSSTSQTLYAGCWDKTIWSWSTGSRSRSTRFQGHRDFVKCVITASLPSLSLLVSGAADATIILWDASSGAKLHVLAGHAMGVLSLVLDPATYPVERGKEDSGEAVVLFSASSDREVLRWALVPTPKNPLSKVVAAPLPDAKPLLPHEVTIYAMAFAPGDDEPDLWTASADGTIRCMARGDDWKVDTTLEQGKHVRCLAFSKDGKWVVTGGRDEDVWLWDKSSAECVGRWDGHYDEIMGVLAMGERVVSAGLDGTIRVWSFRDKIEDKEEDNEKADNPIEPELAPPAGGGGGSGEREREGEEEKGGVTSGEVSDDRVGEGRVGGQSGEGRAEMDTIITTEEEAELDALMDDGDYY